ncbi:MAG: CpXC domain-containing protein [Anaerolineae bacterium]|nr:CpXC domain-containing protein [Anaerolineae bacterium]
MASRQRTTVKCPQCGAQFTAEVHTIIDVSQEPALKSEFLAGRINMATCPTCGTQVALSAPILYHDSSKEFLGVFIPPQANLTEVERQQRIGQLTNALMNSLPPAQRKAYLLQPRQFLTMQSMIEAVLEADGITREMLESQRERLSLLERLSRAVHDEAQLQAIAAENDKKIDAEFFALASTLAESAAAGGDQQAASQITLLLDKLMEMTSFGRRLKAQRDILTGIDENTTREDILERLINAKEDAAIEALVLVAFPLMDYYFFQLLAERIDRAEKRRNREEARRLRALRDRVLELREQQESALRSVLEEASQLLQAALESDDPAAVLRARKDEINETFMNVVVANAEAAARQGNITAARRLREIWDITLDVLEEELPADLRLINRLLRAEYPGWHAQAPDGTSRRTKPGVD